MEDSKRTGIVDLISELCEKFSKNPSRIKRLRSKCYEILLGKKHPSFKNKFKDLSTDDPYCNLIAWQYTLSHEHKLSKCAEQILELHNFIHESYGNDNKLDTYQSILKFLLRLRNIPTIKDDHMDLSLLPQFGPDPNFTELFKLPASVFCESTPFSDTSFYFKPIKKPSTGSGLYVRPSCICSHLSNGCKIIKIHQENVKEEIILEENETNIWEIAAKEQYSNRRTWETYGYPEPEKEPIFLSELGDLSSLWVDNLHFTCFPKFINKPVVKSKRMFIKDLKYLLVGMASESFTYNDFGELVLIPEITLEGITLDTFETYGNDFTLSGTCYKALYEISLPDPTTNKYRCRGYIFAELCESLGTYLRFYRTAIMSIPDSLNLLEFSAKTDHLRKQITTLASICKVGPYKESENLPNGVLLLNYLYQKITDVVDKTVIFVLYSILFPCCQIYFGRFILQWILHGCVKDPYDEFFIKTNYKYISTRGRTYWTRSFIVRQDIIPDFLNDLNPSIMLCGKMMNLLKLCHPFSKLCVYLMGKKPQIVSCCITKDQLTVLEQNAQTYYLEASEVCGPKLSIEFIIRKEKEMQNDLLDLISKKRSATLKRMELERQKNAQEEYEKKLEERAMLKEQYDMSLHQKQFRHLQDLEREIELIEINIQISKRRETLIQEEAKDMIEYYEQLFKISDARRLKVQKHIELLHNFQLDPIKKKMKPQENINATSEVQSLKNEPEETTQSLIPHIPEIHIGDDKQNQNKTEEFHSSKSLDELNANLNSLETEEKTKENSSNNNIILESTKTDNFKHSALKNFEIAKQNKRRVLNQELGITTEEKCSNKTQTDAAKIDKSKLSEAQKNKIKIMSSEFDIDFKPRERVEKELTILDINRYKMMSSSVFSGETYVEKKIDNENIVNKNVVVKDTNKKTTVLEETEEKDKSKTANKNVVKDTNEKTTVLEEQKNTKTEISESKIKKSTSLTLDFNFKKETRCISDSEKGMPMSIDSTPLSDITSISTTSKIIAGDDKGNFNSFPTTAATELTDDGGFKFTDNYAIPDSSNYNMDKCVFSKIFSSEDLKNIKPMCLKMFLSQSLSYSLAVQMKLVNSEVLSYFINDLGYLKHLNNLKSYFFLQNGEFGKSLTETLFHKLYRVKFPIELIHVRVLGYIIHGALEDCRGDDFKFLSFKINNLPDGFNLGDVDILNCISLTYHVEWPLNILLPSDAIAKYNDVFKFLLKINRMNWILKKIFMNLKILAKEVGRKEQYLMISVHYRRIHQYRYVMMHFIQTLQNYITGEVFQTHWALLEKNMEAVTNLDELYDAHTSYLKNILFMCLLNQRSAPLKRVLDKIFTVILKFYDHLRSKKWECRNGTFCHPSFTKLDTIFQNFKELVYYLLKVGRKVVKNGYQPHFKHFLDALNTNGYYSKILVS